MQRKMQVRPEARAIELHVVAVARLTQRADLLALRDTLAFLHGEAVEVRVKRVVGVPVADVVR